MGGRIITRDYVKISEIQINLHRWVRFNLLISPHWTTSREITRKFKSQWTLTYLSSLRLHSSGSEYFFSDNRFIAVCRRNIPSSPASCLQNCFQSNLGGCCACCRGTCRVWSKNGRVYFRELKNSFDPASNCLPWYFVVWLFKTDPKSSFLSSKKTSSI